jgi:hypothetical protein
MSGLFLIDRKAVVLEFRAKCDDPPIHMPFRFEAAILSRIRSLVISLLN